MKYSVHEIDGVQVFDLREVDHQLARNEWTPHLTRDPADLLGVVLHAWGVRSVGTMSSMRARYGEVLALAMRALATPYGISCGVTALGGVPVVAIAHPIARYTFASDAANANYLSIGVMGLFAYNVDDPRDKYTEMTPTLGKAIGVALQVAADLLPGNGPHALITHRQCANQHDDHLACPGELLVAEALASSAVRDGRLVADPDLVILPKFGKAWPEHWRRHLARPQEADAERPQECPPSVDGAGVSPPAP